MRRLIQTLLASTSAAFALTSACAPNEEETLRRDVLAHLADDVFVPTHESLATNAATLRPTLTALCDAPGPTYADAQTAWSSTRAEWSRAAAFMFGPIAAQMQAGPLDFWPVRTATIDAAIAEAPETADAAYLDGLGTSAKGMPAYEYLLFGEDLTGIGAFQSGSAPCAYMGLLADDIAERTAELAAAWPAEAAALKTAGESGSKYARVQDALDVVVNATIENLYAMVKTKLDRPLGNLTGSPVDPELVESRFSRNSLADLGDNLDGFARVYLGADLEPGGEPGLGALVAARDPDLDASILAQLDRTRAALDAVEPTLADALIADRTAVQLARDEIDALRRLVKLDVATLLNVTLSLSDNDGD